MRPQMVSSDDDSVTGKDGSDDNGEDRFQDFVKAADNMRDTNPQKTQTAAQIAAELIAKLNAEMETDKRRLG